MPKALLALLRRGHFSAAVCDEAYSPGWLGPAGFQTPHPAPGCPGREVEQWWESEGHQDVDGVRRGHADGVHSGDAVLKGARRIPRRVRPTSRGTGGASRWWTLPGHVAPRM